VNISVSRSREADVFVDHVEALLGGEPLGDDSFASRE
jgi:hypothetical protein